MSNKIGFIGCGKMASAIIKGIISSGFVKKENITASEISTDIAKKASENTGINVITDNNKLVSQSNVIFIATKPNYVEDVLKEIKDNLNNEKLVVSIAAGVSTKKIEAVIGNIPVIRVMPNTPALVMEGMSATAKGTFATDEQENYVCELLSKIGKCISVTEDKIDIVTAISGSGPAFFYEIFHEMAKAGEKLGLDYEKSLLLAVQTAIGSAKMVTESEKTPSELVQAVATKGGCTEVGINYMKDTDSEKMFYELIKKTTEKAHALG